MKVHPYADMFPMASEEELAELAESIKAVGLIQPVVVTSDGLVLDGRNRLEACRRAGVEPHFVTRDGSDDELKDFVIGVNTAGRRESMSTGIAAASVALILGVERRVNGQWDNWGGRGKRRDKPETHVPGLEDSGWRKAMARVGLVLDELGAPYLEEIRDGKRQLGPTWEEAKAIRAEREDAERRRIAAAEDEKKRETYATEYFQNHSTAKEWLDSKPEGVFATMREAHAAYMEADRKAREVEERRRREEERARREQQDRVKRYASWVETFVSVYSGMKNLKTLSYRDDVLAALNPMIRERFLTIEKELHSNEHE